MIKIKSKKGIIKEEVLKLLIAVIAIGLLMYLAWSLYSIFIIKSRTEQARAGLNEIMLEIENLEDGEMTYYNLITPSKWALFIWPIKFGPTDEYLRPDLCIRNNWEKCICICPVESINSGPQVHNAECSDGGFCEEFEGEIVVDSIGAYGGIGKALAYYGIEYWDEEKTAAKAYYNYPFYVDYLVKRGLSIEISLKDGVYKINVPR